MMRYHLTPSARVALATLQNGGQTRSLLLEGPPGTGKTSLGEFFASEIGAPVIYYLCHHWSSDEELFLAVDIGKVALGSEVMATPEDAYRDGVLLRAAKASQRGSVVLIIDELDKAPTRVDALLLDFLQNGRVYLPSGEVIRAKGENLFVFITSNGVREISEPLIRRCFRLRMSWLPVEVELSLLKEAGIPEGLAKALVRAAAILRAAYDQEALGGFPVSLQEMREAGIALLDVATSKEDVAAILRGFIASSDESWRLLGRGLGSIRGFGTHPESVFWGVLNQVRGGEE